MRLLFPTAAVGMALVAESTAGAFNLSPRRPGSPCPSRSSFSTSPSTSSSALPRRAGALAPAPHAPRRPRVRRHDRRALPSGRDPAVDADQARGRRALGAPAVAVLIFEVLLNATSMFNHGNVRLPRRRRPRAALGRGDARNAPRPPLDSAARDQQQFRLQPALVGPAVRHLSRRARGRTRSG